ncbi:MAG TPA: RNA-binding S4 domain-containing protein [Clostridia bacterium]|nr:RNA-binding S4 domain-containing protein [Clostridia bacterium]
MRLDKYLKVARIIKRRTVANEACNRDRVTINGKEAKPSKEVKVGDVCTIGFGDKKVVFKVLAVPEGNVSKNSSAMLYEIIEDK